VKWSNSVKKFTLQLRHNKLFSFSMLKNFKQQFVSHCLSLKAYESNNKITVLLHQSTKVVLCQNGFLTKLSILLTISCVNRIQLTVYSPHFEAHDALCYCLLSPCVVIASVRFL